MQIVALSALDPTLAERQAVAGPPTYIGLPDAPFRVEIATIAARPTGDAADDAEETSEQLRIITIVY